MNIQQDKYACYAYCESSVFQNDFKADIHIYMCVYVNTFNVIKQKEVTIQDN